MGTPASPNSREEQYLANMAGQNVAIPATQDSRKEQYYKAIIDRIDGGGGGGTTNYNQLSNKPQINSVTLQGNKSSADLGLAGLEGNTFTQTQKVNAAAYAGMKLQDGSDPTTVFTDFGKTGMYISDGDGVETLAYKNIANKTELAGKQDTLTAGENITIVDNVISATGGGYGPTVVQDTGNSTTDVMSQDATTKMVFQDGNVVRVKIGRNANTHSEGSIAIGHNANAAGRDSVAIGYAGTYITQTSGDDAVAIGNGAKAATGAISIGCHSASDYSVSPNQVVRIGYKAHCTQPYSIALGSLSKAEYQGQMQIGLNNSSSSTSGYNGSAYRLLSGLYDGQTAHDAATVGQAVGDTETYTVATSDWTALASSTPYTYSATVTATHTIGNNTIVELYNDNPVLFATNGFAVGSVSGQSVVLYSIGVPSASVSLKVNYKG